MKKIERFRCFLEKEIDFECPSLMILMPMCYLSITNIYKKTHFATFDFFCKNEACVNCGTHKLNFRFDIQIVCYRSKLNLNFLKCLL